MKTRKVIGFNRPETVPANYEVHNAPRPIYAPGYTGHVWQGDFISGVFFVAFDPNDPKADEVRAKNESLDATKIVSVTPAEVIAEMIEYYRVTLPKIYEKHNLGGELADEVREQLIQTWFNREMNWS